MKIQFYPLIYTATRGLDYDLWLSPPDVSREAVDICRRCMADDLYGVSRKTKRLYVKTTEFVLWGVSISNSMMIALDPYYYKDAAERPIRGFYGAYIPLDSGIDMPQTLPLDFDEGLPFTQNMLFEPFVQPNWAVDSRAELKQTASIQNLTLDDNDSLPENVSALSASLKNPSPGCFYGLAPRNDETLNGLIQSFVRSQKNVGIVTGVESLIQARDLAKLFNIQFIELAKATEDSEIKIEPEPVSSSFVKPDNIESPNEDKSEDGLNPKFTSTKPYDFSTSNKKDGVHSPVFIFPNKTGNGRIEPEPLNTEEQGDSQTDNSSRGNFTSHDDNEENVEDLFTRLVRFIFNIFSSLWGESSNGDDNVQNDPNEKKEQSSVFRPKSESEKKPFVPARKIVSERPSNPAFDNRPDSPFSDNDARNPDLLNKPFLSDNDDDSNDPL